MSNFVNHIEDGAPGRSGTVIIPDINDIEHDISSDIRGLLNDRTPGMYLSDRFKYRRHCIDIIYPGVPYPWNRSLIEHPDRVRFLLSLYPEREKLEDVERIILQPRHIEINGIELVAIYLRNEGTLALYLHRPHLCAIDSREFDDYFFIPYIFPHYVSGESPRAGYADSGRRINRIPPLWHILSTVSFSPIDIMDKFFLICNEPSGGAVSEALDSISTFYSRRGY